MKKILLALGLTLGTSWAAMAQVPQAMNYQGIARDEAGKLLGGKVISLRISVLTGGANGAAVYTETHKAFTNAYGSFSLPVGRGQVVKGDFASINWGGGNQYLQVEMDAAGGTNYKLMGASELLSVPYAFYAGTAARLSGETSAKSGPVVGLQGTNGIPSQTWSLFGNSRSDPATDKLGTTDLADLVMVTNDLERLRITSNGDINIKTNLNVGNDLHVVRDAAIDRNTVVGNDLTVKQNVYLNTLGGTTTNNGPFTVARTSATALTGTLTVDKATNLKSTLNADGAATLGSTLNVTGATKLANTLGVTGATSLDNILTVAGATSLNNTLGVTGAANLNSTLGVTGATTLKSTLGVTGSTTLGSTLGVTGPATLGSSLRVNGSTFTKALNTEGKVSITAALTGDKFNSGNYPLAISGANQGIMIQVNGESNSSKNYLSFVNGSNTIVGSVEGQTLSELKNSFDYGWQVAMNAGNVAFVIAEGVATGVQLDLGEVAVMALEGIVATAEMTKHIVDMENKAGVTYESGSGDYAEWLERNDAQEKFSFGDVVGVKGGKITHNTATADHFMVVSMSPIVLGNSPAAEAKAKSEKIAFMGQVPVKVLGSVNIGDYIVPSGNNDGMGRAVSPAAMTLDQYRQIVGVAWEAAPNRKGVGLVNVAVGINSNDMAQKLQQQQQELDATRTKMNSIVAYLKAKDPSFSEEPLGAPASTSGATRTALATVAAPTQAAPVQMKATPKKNSSNYASVTQMFEKNPTLLRESMDKARLAFEKHGVDINANPELKRLFTDEQYFMAAYKKLQSKQ
ncbi:hypothetical protein [Hymenobacter sp. GOD-10R]|uniref:hypothetical protein n=1 Tax=Hymenobacter sp. GOD-10R TaxID=3093922 RepID=UPI002D76CB71|nr:hypothetical protein [Hymenobacter sp. GOD-10R]WRQ30149.1 hypothetical protein SD425_07730 [Hymenobacter sp. GOD-10R]